MKTFFGMLLLCIVAGSLDPVLAAEWTDAELSAPGAGEKLAIASVAEKNTADALDLLEKNAPRLPAGIGKRRAYTALARLREVIGNFSLAADAWLAASQAENGLRHDASLLESARCLMAVGETEKASAHIRTVLLTGKEDVSLSRARILSAYAAAFQKDPAAFPLLKSFADNGVYATERPAILFLLARIFGDTSARERLLGEYPHSPEALVITGKRAAIASLPLWLLPANRSAVAVKMGTSSQVAAQEKKPPEISGKATSQTGGAVALQVGLFKAEKNARALVSRLSSKGFTASSAARVVSGVDYWVVTVAPLSSAEETMMKLKDAGFESFPLF